ncbi:glycosyltransferase family 2 protein [Prochlorococcus sp. MIT 1341]|uniref:glycosyltransferase family 2 protein n=1 Tax=Prochlorococcus sp. MIT 1341 TaxID=3096221 RepID=UPI002A7562E0|nr:glycosyltransferase family 2 protein [Prochlorococcus sp. MIT 1341]
MEKSKDLVSIVLPVYNGSRYIEQAINSLLIQSYQNLEIIAVDDGSDDNSVEIITNIAKNDSRIKLVKRDHEGLIETLKFGIGIAKGKYIGRMDADDISHKSRIEKQINLLKSKKADICGCSFYTINETSFIKRHFDVPYSQKEFKIRLATSVPFCHGSILTKSKILQEFIYGEGGELAVEDYSLWTKMAMEGVKFANCKEPLYYLRVNRKSFTFSKGSLVPKGRLSVGLNYISQNQEELLTLVKPKKIFRGIKKFSCFIAGDYLYLLKVLSRYHKNSNRICITGIRLLLSMKYIIYLVKATLNILMYKALNQEINIDK